MQFLAIAAIDGSRGRKESRSAGQKADDQSKPSSRKLQCDIATQSLRLARRSDVIVVADVTSPVVIKCPQINRLRQDSFLKPLLRIAGWVFEQSSYTPPHLSYLSRERPVDVIMNMGDYNAMKKAWPELIGQDLETAQESIAKDMQGEGFNSPQLTPVDTSSDDPADPLPPMSSMFNPNVVFIYIGPQEKVVGARRCC
ncbi:hypothetical protein JKP88DRAFT_255667 [Tribonema minus]|uniref:Uncharacterized protein n=1 Tax=Tribonema minus TaxID=303371 RepID=A0A835YYC2_9STRA|nr:hypothetical protein JKP88DRAFT_255667 [Tribonema minus]